MCKRMFFLAALVVVVGLVGSASALTYRWTDANDVATMTVTGDWMDPCNWDPPQVPGFNDTAFMATTNLVVGGTWPVLNVSAPTIGHLKPGSDATYAEMVVKTGGYLYVSEDSETGSAGDILVGNTTGCTSMIYMTGGSLGGFDNYQMGKRSVGTLHLDANSDTDPGGSPYFFSFDDGYMKIGNGDGKTAGSDRIYLDNGTIHTAGIHYYLDVPPDHLTDITAGVLEAGPERLGMVGGYYPSMQQYIEDMYNRGWITCYGGAGEINITFNSPLPSWVTVWCDAREPNCAGFPNYKSFTPMGPYLEDCPVAAGSATKRKLIWEAGDTADQHNVYLGADYDDVDNGTGGTQIATLIEPNESPPIDVNLSTTYYWRVEEVNSVTGIVCHGRIWRFVIDHCICIDDFESYNPATFPAGTAWSDDGDDCIISIDVTVPLQGNQCMKMDCADIANSFADAILTVPAGAALRDWSYGGQAVALTLWYKADTPAEDIQLQVNASGYVSINPILDNCWHQANVTFAALGDACNNVTTFTIRALDGVWNDEAGTDVFIDAIAICEPRCVPDEGPVADLDDDCDVDELDLQIMGNDWLLSDANRGPLDVEFGGADANGPAWVTDPCRGQVLYFDGENDYLELPREPFALFHDKTIATWINRQETGKENEGTGYIFKLYEGGYRVYDGIQTGRSMWRIDGGSTLRGPGFPADEWTHLAFVIRDDCDLAVAELYKNAVLLATDTPRPQHADITGFSPALVGNNTDGAHAWAIHALMSELRVYDYALSQNEIAYLASDGLSGAAPVASKLIYRYSMNQSSGTTVLDDAAMPKYAKLLAKANITDPEAVGSRLVNFKDYVILGNEWGTTKNWP